MQRYKREDFWSNSQLSSLLDLSFRQNTVNTFVLNLVQQSITKTRESKSLLPYSGVKQVSGPHSYICVSLSLRGRLAWKCSVFLPILSVQCCLASMEWELCQQLPKGRIIQRLGAGLCRAMLETAPHLEAAEKCKVSALTLNLPP